MKRSPMNWWRTCVSFIFDKSLMSKIYKELIGLIIKKKKKKRVKMGRGIEEIFFQRHTDSK